MKITFPNGVTVEITGGEEIAAALPAVAGLAGLAEQVTAPETIPTPVPATVMPSPPAPTPIAATPHRARPKQMYVTDIEATVMRVLKQFPDGITAGDIAALLDLKVEQVNSTLWRLRTQRPFKGSLDVLLVKSSNDRFLATPLGMKVKLLVSLRPNYVNPGAGWV
jgi:hypothetical protein